MIFTKRGGNMKKANKFKYKRVRIYWQDPTSNPEWMTVKKALEENYSWCDDIGYLLFKDQRKLLYLLRIVLMMMANLLLATPQFIHDLL